MKIISALGYSTQQNYHTKLTEEEKSSMIKKKKKTKTTCDHQATTMEDSTRNSAHRR
jgi:hypothetical protein